MSPDQQITLAVDDKGCVVGIGKTPYFVAEDFEHVTTRLYGQLKNFPESIDRGELRQWMRAAIAEQANAKVQPLIEEIERLREENEKMKSAMVVDENGNEYVLVCILKEKINELRDALEEARKHFQACGERAQRVGGLKDCGDCGPITDTVDTAVEAIDLALGKGGGT